MNWSTLTSSFTLIPNGEPQIRAEFNKAEFRNKIGEGSPYNYYNYFYFKGLIEFTSGI